MARETSQVRKSRALHIGLERLEARAMLSVATDPPPNSVILDGSVVTVGATDGSDTILVSSSGTNLMVTVNGHLLSSNLPLGSISQILVFGLDGDDSIKITGIAKPVMVDGGDGSDQLVVNGRSTGNSLQLSDGALLVNGVEYDMTAVEQLRINGQAGADALIVAPSGLPDIPVVFNGGRGANSIVGPDLPLGSTNNWTVTGHNTGTLGSELADGLGGSTTSELLSFSQVQKLVGGSGDDTWTLKPRASIGGRIDGGGGANSLVYGYTAAVTVNLQTAVATGTAGFKNIGTFIGASSTKNTLVAANQVNQWTISNVNEGDVNGVQFSGFANPRGGSLADTFQFTAQGSVTGKLGGGSGRNTLTGPDQDNIWKVTAKNSGKLNSTSFANIQNLVGGSEHDDFILAAGAAVSGRVNGGGGDNA